MEQNPDQMTGQERLDEISEIMAKGIVRLKCKKLNKMNILRDISLDSSANQSVHAVTQNGRRK